MSSQRVLIVGAGVAGSILAFWLVKHDFRVVVVERSKAEQKAGQGIEIQEPALQVVKAMGVLDKLREKQTGEKGVTLLDQRSRSYGTLEAGRLSLTGNLELMRGDLTEVLYRAADEFHNVEFQFESTIQSLIQTEDKVIVSLENRNTKAAKTEEFDFVIGADGAKSRTRQLIMGVPEKHEHFNRVGAFVAYFSIPREDQDWPYSRICHFTDRRVVWLRPVAKGSKVTSVYFVYLHDNVPALRQANADGDRMKQKEAFAEIFGGLGWEMSRIIGQMMKAENFYSDELVQVKFPKWSENRVGLVGDAAWAPTPFTGEGNQLAIIGAWVLAQEMSRDRTPKAFQSYEKRLRAHVEDAQSVPLSGRAPYLFCPKTIWGIRCFRMMFFLLACVARLLAWTNLTSILPDQRPVYFDLEMDRPEAKKEQ